MRPARFLVLPAVALVPLALLVACTPKDGPPQHHSASEGLRRAALRTVAERTARIDGTAATNRTSVVITGVVSLVDRRALITTSTLQGSSSAEMRMTNDGAWVKPPGADAWIAIPTAAQMGSVAGWHEVFDELSSATEVRRNRRGYDGLVAGRRATVDVDNVGRIRRVRVASEGRSIDVRFHHFGEPLDVVAP